MIRMLDPTGTDERRDRRLAERDGLLAGKRLGLLANGKTNGAALLEILGEILTERHGMVTPVLVDKGNASAPAPDAVLETLLRRCDVVVTAIGD